MQNNKWFFDKKGDDFWRWRISHGEQGDTSVVLLPQYNENTVITRSETTK